MANVIPTNVLFLKNATLKLGSDNYEAALSSVAFAPTSTDVTFQGLTPTATYNAAGVSTWEATLTFAQDWTTPNSLSRYLYAHEGESVPAVFVPEVGTNAPTFTATVVLKPGNIGGDVNTQPTSTVTLKSTKPVIS